LLGLWQYPQRAHQKIKSDDVTDIYVWADGQGLGRIQKVAVDKEKTDIVNWFNSASDIRLNKSFAGETPQSGIVISIKNEKDINILRSGIDFEIQRVDSKTKEIKSYWARQKNIKDLLELLLKIPDAQQKVLINTFVKAEYSGDIKTLLSITKEEANIMVRNNKITVYQTSKLDKIISTTLLDMNNSGMCKFIVSVSSIVNGKNLQQYNENLTMKKFNQKWYVVKIEYDA
jgi:hypothetical protein